MLLNMSEDDSRLWLRVIICEGSQRVKKIASHFSNLNFFINSTLGKNNYLLLKKYSIAGRENYFKMQYLKYNWSYQK